MLLRAIQNPEGWMAALMLDPETGLDPPGVKIRAAQGIDAAQKFIEGYWLWCATCSPLKGVAQRLTGHTGRK